MIVWHLLKVFVLPFFLRFISLQSGYAGKEEVVCQGPLWKQL